VTEFVRMGYSDQTLLSTAAVAVDEVKAAVVTIPVVAVVVATAAVAGSTALAAA
jgi:hypothetical protein